MNGSTIFAFSNWQTGEPNDQNGEEDDEENGGYLNASGEWSDLGGALQRAFVCER